MNDRELLEKAAKTAELPECGWMGPAFMYVKDGTFTDWNPLTDDGDAFRLAAQLGFDLKFGKSGEASLHKQSSQPSPDEIIAAHAKRLAMDLECMLLASDPGVAVNRWWAEAQTSLDSYKTDIDRLYPQDHVSPLGKD